MTEETNGPRLPSLAHHGCGDAQKSRSWLSDAESRAKFRAYATMLGILVYNLPEYTPDGVSNGIYSLDRHRIPLRIPGHVCH